MANVIGLGEEARKKIGAEIERNLADTQVLTTKTRGFHWNVSGPYFAPLHALFDAQYTALSLAQDELAERMRALAIVAGGSNAQFLKETRLKEQAGAPDWKAMVKELADDHDAMARHARSAAAVAEGLGDVETNDLFVGRATEHGKAAWMLRSHLE